MEKYFFAGITAFLLTVVLTALALKFFPKLKLMDRPLKYGLTRKPIPYYGGLILFAVFIVTAFFFLPLEKHLTGVFVGAALITGISFLDDMFNLRPSIRLFVQILAAVSVTVSGVGIQSITNPFGGSVVLNQDLLAIPVADGFMFIPILAVLFTVVWIVGMVNTMNFLDGLNGLPSGISFIAFLVLFFLAIWPGHAVDQTEVAYMAAILAASTLAFLLFDFYPAKILMGDTGSMFLGFMLAVLAIFAGGKVATAFLVMGFPILDAAWVIVRRILQGRSPFKGDLKHLHHRLLEIGLSQRKALFLIYGLSASFGITALFLGTRQKLFALITLFILMVGVGALVVYYGRQKVPTPRSYCGLRHSRDVEKSRTLV